MKTLLATTGNGLVRATCSIGTAWSVEQHLPNMVVRCLATVPSAHTSVFAGTHGDGVLRSDDGGKSWRSSGLAGQIITALATSPSAPDTIYAGTKPACLFVSHDAGAHWAELGAFRHIPGRRFWWSPAEPPFRAYVQAIAVSPTDAQHLLIGIEVGAVVQSRDGGRSWAGHCQGALRDCHSLTFHTTNNSWIYEAGGSGAGVAVSRDAGATWKQPKAHLDHHYGWAVAADPARPEVWYASVSPSPWKAHGERNAQASIVRSIGGGPWEALRGGLPQPLLAMPYALFTDPATPGDLYAGLSNGEVWQGSNYGDQWCQLPVQLGRIARTLIAL